MRLECSLKLEKKCATGTVTQITTTTTTSIQNECKELAGQLSSQSECIIDCKKKFWTRGLPDVFFEMSSAWIMPGTLSQTSETTD